MMNALSVKPLVGTGGAAAPPTALLTMSAAEKNKQWQQELLMERIRAHSSQHKSFQELSKSMRMSMLEKRYALDSVEKSNLQKCLDSMQHCIKVTSRQGLVERLESLSRQLGLKFMEDTSGLFISTDMFYLEIILDASGTLSDVKVHHECKIEQQSCSELVNCLNRGDFSDFTVQLEGLSSIYQLNAEPKVKKKAFVALQAMETDLYNLFQMQSFSKDAQQLLDQSTVGIVLKRRGGHPMKLTYFVSPYDLISLESKCLQPLSIELLSSKDIGLSVTVNLEAASANKLQVAPTVTFAKDAQTGVELPVYAALTQTNSTLLPATFVLRLNKPLPVCSATLRALLPNVTATAESAVNSESKAVSAGAVSTIMNLIVQTASEQQLKNSAKGLFVCLPDQTHCYFFTDNKQLKATLLSSVSFTEPAQVPGILAFLKKQTLFYTLLSSCVRPQTKMGNDMDSTTILEVNAISFQQISVSLQHPYDESMATVEFNLHDATVSCVIYSLSRNYDLLSIKLTNIVQKSLSIPVTLRALLKFWDQERLKLFQRGIGTGSTGATGGGNVNAPGGGNAFGNFSLSLTPTDPGGRGGGSSSGGGVGGSVGAVKQEPNGQRQFLPGLGATAGYLKFKPDLKQEDFHESPKSQTQMQSVEASSLGQTQQLHQQQQQQQQQQQLQQQQQQQHKQQTAQLAVLAAGALSSDLEIADKYSSIWKDKTPNLKHSVSITPILSTAVLAPLDTVTNATVAPSIDMKRTGIEIIPLSAQPLVSANSSSSNIATTSITITPINSVGVSVSAKNDKKCAASAVVKRPMDSVVAAAAADVQKEKKRKKRRDDSPMGPPEKVFSRQNSPATIAAVGVGGAEAAARKFSSPSSSPKGASGGLLATAAAGSSIGARPSPKHSPVYSSPKHSTASNSPKSPYGTHSPKHGSSGKPSMSTLKSAAASLSPKQDKNSSGGYAATNLTNATVAQTLVRSLAVAGGGTGSGYAAPPPVASKSRDKDKNALPSSAVASKSSATSQQQPLKTPVALNHLPIGGGSFNAVGGVGTAAAALDAMRKAVPAAVSLMTSTPVSAAAAATTTTAASAAAHGSTDVCGANTASEYMVKQSQEGLKLTINKTSNKSSNSSSSSSASKSKSSSSAAPLPSSRKQHHTGLKPGVNSGPASKKSPATSPSCSKSGISQLSTTTKHVFQKSNSSGNLSSKLSSSGGGSTSRGASDTFRKTSSSSGGGSSSKKSAERERDRERLSTSQPATRLDHHADMMKILQYASPSMAANMEGFMKNLSNKFQIPKLSQRATTPTTVVPAAAATTTATTSTAADASSYAASTSSKAHNLKKPTTFVSLEKKPPPVQTTAAARPPPPPYDASMSAAVTGSATAATTILKSVPTTIAAATVETHHNELASTVATITTKTTTTSTTTEEVLLAAAAAGVLGK